MRTVFDGIRELFVMGLDVWVLYLFLGTASAPVVTVQEFRGIAACEEAAAHLRQSVEFPVQGRGPLRPFGVCVWRGPNL